MTELSNTDIKRNMLPVFLKFQFNFFLILQMKKKKAKTGVFGVSVISFRIFCIINLFKFRVCMSLSFYMYLVK